MAPRQRSLTRFLLQAVLAVMVMRIVFMVGRLLARGAGPGRPLGPTDAGGQARPRTTGKARPRVDRSGVTDVPFTELPAPEVRRKAEGS